MNHSSTVAYQTEPDLSVDEFIQVLQRSTLSERRPADRSRLETMLRRADLIVTARTELRKLIGISRAISDFSYCTYLSDLAVDQDYQRRGIGQQLIRRTHVHAGLQTTLILLSAPAAQTYYPHIGMQPHDSCWVIRSDQ